MFTLLRRLIGLSILALGVGAIRLGRWVAKAGAWLADAEGIWAEREAVAKQIVAESASRPYTGGHGPTT